MTTSGLYAPSNEQWLMLDRMNEGEHLYIEGIDEGEEPNHIPGLWRGNLSRNRSLQGTYVSRDELNDMVRFKWIKYDPEQTECVLTFYGTSALREYQPSNRSDRAVRRKPNR